MKSKFALTVLAALVFAAPALAADNVDSQKQDAPKEKKICRTETVTGSLIAKRRICRTEAEWNELAANTRKQVDDLGRRENVGGQTGGANGTSSSPLIN